MSNVAIEGLGLVAGTLTTIAFLPQVMHIRRSKSAKGVSLEWIIIFSTGVLLWFIYGLISHATAVFLANGVTLGLVLVILYFKLKFG